MRLQIQEHRFRSSIWKVTVRAVSSNDDDVRLTAVHSDSSNRVNTGLKVLH